MNIQGTSHLLSETLQAGSRRNYDATTSSFGQMLEGMTQANGSTSETVASLEEAARQMEIHLVTFMLKTMDEAGDSGGLLGKSSEGLGYFKDVFFQDMAEQVSAEQGFGFVESLKSTYQINDLSSKRGS